MREKIYLAGPLFSQAEIEWGYKVKAAILEKLGDVVEVVWPYEIASGQAHKIFQTNLMALEECKLMVAILDGPQVDDGTAWEIGYHFARSGAAIGLRTDQRRAGETPQAKVNAMVESSCLDIADSLDGLVSRLKEIVCRIDS